MSSAVVYSNAFKLKTEVQPDLDSLLLFSQSLSSTTSSSSSPADPASLTAAQASLSTCMAKISQLDRLAADLNELGRKEMVASKREVVNGYVCLHPTYMYHSINSLTLYVYALLLYYRRVGQLRQDIAGFKETSKAIKDRLDAKVHYTPPSIFYTNF